MIYRQEGRRFGMLPVVDLNLVEDEAQLLPIFKQVLERSDSFLIKNYANLGKLQLCLEQLVQNEDGFQGVSSMNGEFCGGVVLDGLVNVEQYSNVCNETVNVPAKFNDLYQYLWNMAQFFAQTACDSYVQQGQTFEWLWKLTRFESEVTTFHKIDSQGTLLLFPQAQGIRVKPMTASIDDNIWETVNEPECLLVHTGKQLTSVSEGKHTTSFIQIDPSKMGTYLTLYRNDGDNIKRQFIDEQIREFPAIGQTFYLPEYNHIHLHDEVHWLIKLFNHCETVISLYSMQRPSNGLVNPSLHRTILPQVNNMITTSSKGKIDENAFLQMMTLWPRCYELEWEKDELCVVMPRRNKLIGMVNDSRKLIYYKYAVNYIDDHLGDSEVPLFPLLKKRRSVSPERGNIHGPHEKKIAHLKRRKQVGHGFNERPFDTQENLLQRIKLRENSALLRREEQNHVYDQFLNTKISQIKTILRNLTPGEPYSSTYLCQIIVDSLYDGNNPIDLKESQMILNKICEIEGERIKKINTMDGLTVYRWNTI